MELLLSKEVLTVIAALVVLLIAWKGRKLVNIFFVVFQVWHLLEKLGILASMSGYEKLALGMSVFQEKFYERFGKEPAAGDEGWAVRIFNLLSKLESKDDVDDFFEDSSEPSNSESLEEETA
jgi:hypothetical protein